MKYFVRNFFSIFFFLMVCVGVGVESRADGISNFQLNDSWNGVASVQVRELAVRQNSVARLTLVGKSSWYLSNVTAPFVYILGIRTTILFVACKYQTIWSKCSISQYPMAFTTNRICRTCMAESSALMPIWPTTKSTPVDPSSSITMMLKSFTTIDVSILHLLDFRLDQWCNAGRYNLQAFDGDGLPEHVCITCISELNRAYSFKQKCERSEYTLRMYLQVPMEEEQTKRKDTVESIEPQVTVTVPESPKEQKIQIMVLSRPSLLTSQSATSFVYQCSSCAATFLSLDTLKQHIITVHNAVQCDQSNRCDETEVDPMSTQPNADATIVNQRKFACEICSLEFVKKDIFDDHCSKIHMQEPFEMLNDDAADSFEEITYEHYEETEELNETEEMPTQLKTEINPADEALPPNKDTKFYCSRCNASFAKQLSLNIHFNSKKCMQESYECDICNRVFARKKYLLMHMKLHSNRSSTRVVVIDNDKKINKDRVKLARSEEKRFECSDCPKC